MNLKTECVIYDKVKWSRYRPGVAQKVGRGIALLFHDRDTRRGWAVSSTPWPHFTPWKDPVPILQEVGWAPGSVRTGGKSRLHRDSIPDRPARSQSLYWLSTYNTLCTVNTQHASRQEAIIKIRLYLATCFGRNRPSSGQLRTILRYSKISTQWDTISFTLKLNKVWKFLLVIKEVE